MPGSIPSPGCSTIRALNGVSSTPTCWPAARRSCPAVPARRRRTSGLLKLDGRSLIRREWSDRPQGAPSERFERARGPNCASDSLTIRSTGTTSPSSIASTACTNAASETAPSRGLEVAEHPVHEGGTVPATGMDAVALDGKREPPERNVLLLDALGGTAEAIQRDPQVSGVTLRLPDGQPPTTRRDEPPGLHRRACGCISGSFTSAPRRTGSPSYSTCGPETPRSSLMSFSSPAPNRRARAPGPRRPGDGHRPWQLDPSDRRTSVPLTEKARPKKVRAASSNMPRGAPTTSLAHLYAEWSTCAGTNQR